MMRANKLVLIAGFLFGAPAGLPQTIIPNPPSSLFPSDLRQYLSLTDSQVAAIVQMTADYNQAASTKQQRTLQLQNEIGDLDRQDPLDPMAIGVRYAEIESIRRDLANQLTALRGKLRTSFTDGQQAKLKALDDARKLQPVIIEAQCGNLLDIGPLTPYFGPIPIRPGPNLNFGCISARISSELQQYLSLSSDQVDAINSLNSNNQQINNSRGQRIAQLLAEIVQETAKDPLDPLALGTRYVEIDTINRDIDADLVTLRSQDRAVLNDAQHVKVGSLDDARKLQPLISEAQCENLLDSARPSTIAGIISVPSAAIGLYPSFAFSCGTPSLIFSAP